MAKIEKTSSLKSSFWETQKQKRRRISDTQKEREKISSSSWIPRRFGIFKQVCKGRERERERERGRVSVCVCERERERVRERPRSIEKCIPPSAQFHIDFWARLQYPLLFQKGNFVASVTFATTEFNFGKKKINSFLFLECRRKVFFLTCKGDIFTSKEEERGVVGYEVIFSLSRKFEFWQCCVALGFM